MKQKKWLIAVTAACLLATSAGAGAGPLVEKVTGILQGDVKVTVDGSETDLKPVYIDGKAYLPARETAELLGYNLNWSSQELILKDRDAAEQEEEAQPLDLAGVIVSTEQADGVYRLEVMGHGPNQWLVLSVDEETELSGEDGVLMPADLQPGMKIEARYGPFIAKSFPGQSYAASIRVSHQTSVLEDVITGISQTGDGWQIEFSEEREGGHRPSLVLNVGKETLLLSSTGEELEWSSLYPGLQVKAYYGPAMMKSLPPQSPAHVIIVGDRELSGEQLETYREAAWNFVSEQQKPTVLTEPEEARVEIVPAQTAGILGGSDAQRRSLEALVAAEGQMITVTYNTEMDALLGPLTVVLHPETADLLGYFVRK